MAGLQLEWQWAAPASAVGQGQQQNATAPASVVRPLVVLLPWVWSEPRYVNKYTQLCHERGWDVLVARWPMLALWFPLWSRALAARLLTAVGGQLLAVGPRPVVFWCFSGAAKGLYSSLLRQLADPSGLSQQQAACAAAVLRCAAGQIYDSGPVDFTSDMGRQLLSSSSSANNTPQNNNSSSGGSSNGHSSSDGSSDSRAAAAAIAAAAAAAAQVAMSTGVDVAAGTLDFFLMEWFDRDRDNMWSALATPLRGPVLMLYSRKDELADAAQIASLAAALRRRGVPVLEQVWHDSPHVGHLRLHPEAYGEAVSYLLSQALQEWSSRHSRHVEGRDWVLRWEQQQQQQQQQGKQQQGSQQQQQACASCAGHAADSSVTCNRPISSRNSSSSSGSGSGVHCQDSSLDSQQQQQQQQLVMQPTREIIGSSGGCSSSGSSGGSNGSSGGSNAGRTAQAAAAAAPTLVRAGTSSASSLSHHQSSSSRDSSSGSSSSRFGGASRLADPEAAAAAAAAARAQVLAQQLTPWLLASQMAFDNSSNNGSVSSGSNAGGCSSSGAGSSGRCPRARSPAAAAAAAAAGPGVVRISSWPATATAVAAALSGSEGETGCEQLCADSTLLSHSLRCLANSFVATHRGSIAGNCGSGGCGSNAGSDGGGMQRQLLATQDTRACSKGKQQHKQQQPFMLRMVNKLRSKL